jgi:hypothetical protein
VRWECDCLFEEFCFWHSDNEYWYVSEFVFPSSETAKRKQIYLKVLLDLFVKRR